MDAQYSPGTVPGKILSTTDKISLTLIAVMVVGGTGVAFVESFDGLHQWATSHGLTGWRADIWPFQIDAFIAVGEAALLVATLRRWDLRSKILAGLVAIGGAVISTAANIGHVGADRDLSWYLTAGVPPFIAFVGLMIGLGILKRVISDTEKARAGADAFQVPTGTAFQVPTGTAYQVAPEPVVIPSLDMQADRAMAPAQDVPQLLSAGASVPVQVPADVPERATEGGTDVPEVPDVPVQVPADVPPVPRPREGDKFTRHPKWDEGVKLYRESVETPGAAMSQRLLADALGMRNRSLAAAIIKHVKNEIKNETMKEEKTDDVIDRVLQTPEAAA